MLLVCFIQTETRGGIPFFSKFPYITVNSMALLCIGEMLNFRSSLLFIRIFADEMGIGLLVALCLQGLLPRWVENSVTMPPKISDSKEANSD
jgi:hypothetical protein